MPSPAVELHKVVTKLAELRKRRDELIQQHPGSLREIAQAAGISHEQVRTIKARKR